MNPYLSAKTRVYGLIGNPVSHSLSPAMHNAAFHELSLEAVYVAMRVERGWLEQAINGIRALDLGGINVTVPFKSAVIPFLDKVHPLALRIGSVNTIVNNDGSLHGISTDATGFLRSLEEHGFSPEGNSTVILGAGGSARALLAGLAEAGTTKIHIWNRTRSRATALVDEFQPLYQNVEILVLDNKNLDGLNCDLLINTTSVGMNEDEAPYDLTRAQSVSHVADIIYSPSQTSLLRQAEALGIPNHNGKGMLLHQGCEAFSFWTGLDAPVEIMRRELYSELERC